MKKIIAIINQKGGVGKTTSAIAISAGLAKLNHKVLLIDMDAQCNATLTMLKTQAIETTMHDVLISQKPIADAIQRCEKFDFIASSPAMANADAELAQNRKAYRLKECLISIQDQYDYIILDTPPSLGIITANALTACTDVIIPTQTDTYSLQGIGQLMRTVQSVRSVTNNDLRILGILVVRYNGRTVLGRHISGELKQIAEQINTRIIGSVRECVAVREAQAAYTDVFSYDHHCTAARDYMQIIKDIAKGGNA